jgi:tRNA-dihydrouridine synthase B
MTQIGPYKLDNNVILAPMAGVTDRPFRQLCRKLGAGLVVSEMVTSDMRLWNTQKSQWRLNHKGEGEPRSIQIAGGDPETMADAAQAAVAHGAQIIDINMGCPAKKVCKKAAGSALMRDEKLVADILEQVVSAVNVPVTLKIRTGWSPELRNGVEIARIAESSGIQALAVHGRTRACGFRGEVEYDTVANIKALVKIPVFANGDIATPQDAQSVLAYTSADGVMIGRAAQGRPWLCGQIAHFLKTGQLMPEPGAAQIAALMAQHLEALYSHYGDYMGVRIARKHVGWYIKEAGAKTFKSEFNTIENSTLQLESINRYFQSCHINNKEIAA